MSEWPAPNFNTCRLCNKAGDPSLIKYGVRHYAHPECGLKKWGAAFFDKLHDWQIRNFPSSVARKAGFGEELERRYAALAKVKP